MKRARPIVECVRKEYNESSSMKLFGDFNSYALASENTRYVARLLARELSKLQEEQNEPVRVEVWRCWLRSLLKLKSDSSEAKKQQVLGIILRGADGCIGYRALTVGHSSSDLNTTLEVAIKEKRNELTETLFEDIAKYVADPYLGLMMLKMLKNESIQSLHGYFKRHEEDLCRSILNYVDNYFITQKNDVFEVYKDSQSRRFVLRQWSLSSPQDNVQIVDPAVKGASERQKAVNNYVFGLLDGKPELIYQFINYQFSKLSDPYSLDDLPASGIGKWDIIKYANQYSKKEDLLRIGKIVQQALSSEMLEASQKQELIEFKKLLDKHIAEITIKA